MSLTIRPITAEILNSDIMSRFLARFDDGFSENRSLDNAPWRYFPLPHFHFYALCDSKEMAAVMVTSSHSHNEHLNFLYVDASRRSAGLGERLMRHWQTSTSSRLLTIHVKKDLIRTQHFYQSLGFALAPISSCPSILQPWITKAKSFAPDCYKNNVLMWRDLSASTAPHKNG